MKCFPLLPVLAVFLLASGHASARDTSLSQLSWLGGCWQAEGGEPGSGEQWMTPAGDSMMGMSRTVHQGKTAGFEFMRIARDAEGNVAFFAQPSGKPATKFSTQRMNSTEVAFENPGHDFPQRVIYRQVSPTQLQARIEGTINGASRQIDFPMTRTRCDPPPTQATTR